MKRFAWILAAAALHPTLALAATAPLELRGKIAPQLALDSRMQMPLFMTVLPPEKTAELPAPLAPGDKAFGGSAAFPLPAPVRVVLIEPKAGRPWLYVDRDQNGKLAAEERFPLTAETGGEAQSADVSLHFTKGAFSSYPLKISKIPEENLHMPPAMKAKADVILMVASRAYVEGRVPINGKEVLVRYRADPAAEQLDPSNGAVQMDVNGDGKIDSQPGSLENDISEKGDALFKIGEQFVSLQAIDLAAGTMTLRSHPASDYLRLDLSPGSVLPDFSFVDLEGKAHKLSDWRGRHVLLDFWATWCAPCIAEFPNLKKTYEQYHARGFDVVSLVYHEEDDKARKFLEKPENQLPWIHATWESTRDLAIKRLRIQSIPTLILLDPQGKVVSTSRTGEPALEGEGLSKTLAGLLPAGGSKPTG